jgi:AAA domain
MALQFTTVEAAAERNGVKVLVYGGPGLGKTVLSATMGPGSVLISAESGVLSLRKPNLERMFGVGNPSINYNLPVIVVKTVLDFRDALAWCQHSMEARSFQNIGIDSVSEIAEVVLNTAKGAVKDPRQAYGELTEQMEKTVRGFRDLPGKNVYMAAKMDAMKDELTGLIRYGASMPGRRLGPAMPYFFDEVFRLGINKTPQGESYRFLQTQPDMQFDAKDRSGALAPIEEPHLSKIFSKILGA